MNAEPRPSLPPTQRVAVDLSEPYPELTAEHRNAQYARMLERNLGSAGSEMSSICQYMYQSWILSASHPELSDICARIAQVEMRHLNILGRLIELLGGTPRFAAPTANGCQPWNGNMLYYSRNPQSLLRHSIAQEQAAAEGYEAEAMQIHDPYVSAMLRRMAKAELLHRDIFQSCLERMI